MVKPRLTHTHFRYSIVGATSTAIDFGAYALLNTLGWAPLFSNLISTSCGMLNSFFMNRHFTFQATTHTKRSQIVRYIAVTMAGQWLIQPLIIYGVRFIGVSSGSHNITMLNLIAKLCATGVTFFWNYLWYSRYVFKHSSAPRLPDPITES